MREGVFPLSPRVRNIGFALFIAGILAYGAALSAHMLASFDLVNLLRDVNLDDSFYYFQIAANLAEGKFSTFDGGITRTNGYHPLWMLMITPFYWFFDKETALFAIKAFEIMLVAGAIALIAVAARLARLPWILLFALPPLLYRHHSSIAGMEAAAALFTLGLLFAALTLYARNPARWKWALAAVAFALPWARLEYVAISLAATGAMLFIEWSRRWRTHGASWSSLLSLDLIAPPLGAIAGILAYFAYNGIVFGGIVPVSGATKQMWSQMSFEEEGGYSLVKNFQDVLQIPVFDYELLIALAICVCLPMVWWLSRRYRNQVDWLLLAFLAGAFSLAAGHLAKFAHTVTTTHPIVAADHPWHFVPAYLMMALSVPVSCYLAISLIRCLVSSKSRMAANALSAAVVIAAAVFLFVNSDFTSSFRRIDHLREANSREWEVTSYMGVLLMDRTLPEDSVVGSWDAGVIGYFSRFPVVNLDGLVNSYEYMRAPQAERNERAFRRYRITHFANTYSSSRSSVPRRLLFDSDPAQYERQFRLWSAKSLEDLDASAWFWERMEPSFDYQSNGVGAVFDGRLAQAFAKDCAPGDEFIVWSRLGGEEEPIVTQWTKTRTGLCVSAIVLPHDALPPVRVESILTSEYIASLIGDNPPAIRSGFDVYMNRERSKLIYSRDDCADGDAAPAFFLHIYPVDASDLPQHRKQHGFDNLDFRFEGYGFIHGGGCFAIHDLPHYNFTAIRTGQYIPGEGRIWEGEIRLGE